MKVRRCAKWKCKNANECLFSLSILSYRLIAADPSVLSMGARCRLYLMSLLPLHICHGGADEQDISACIGSASTVFSDEVSVWNACRIL